MAAKEVVRSGQIRVYFERRSRWLPRGAGGRRGRGWGLGLSTGRVEMLSIALRCQRGEAAGEKGGSQGQKTGLGLGCEVGDIISHKE